MSRSASK